MAVLSANLAVRVASLHSLFCLVPPAPASSDDAGSDSFVCPTAPPWRPQALGFL